MPDTYAIMLDKRSGANIVRITWGGPNSAEVGWLTDDVGPISVVGRNSDDSEPKPAEKCQTPPLVDRIWANVVQIEANLAPTRSISGEARQCLTEFVVETTEVGTGTSSVAFGPSSSDVGQIRAAQCGGTGFTPES